MSSYTRKAASAASSAAGASAESRREESNDQPRIEYMNFVADVSPLVKEVELKLDIS